MRKSVKPDVVDVLQDRAGGEVRAALGHDVHLVEDLQRGDHLQHHDQRRGAAEQRDGDPPDLLPRAGAVDRRRLVEVARDLLQPGEVEHEVEAERPPDGGDAPATASPSSGRRASSARSKPILRERRRRAGPAPACRARSRSARRPRTAGRTAAKNASRKNHRPRPARSASSASTKASTTSGGVVRIVNHSVCHSDDQKSALLQRLGVVAEARRSRRGPGLTRLVSKKLITRP